MNAGRKGYGVTKGSRGVGAYRLKALMTTAAMAVTVATGAVIGIGFPGGVADAAAVFGQSVGITPISGMNWDEISDVSCTSAGNCTAVGLDEDPSPSYDEYGFAISEIDGLWGTPQVLTSPGNAASNPEAILSGVSCWSAGNCVAVGSYEDLPSQRPMEATETNGSWSQLTELSQLPTGASSYNALMLAVSCPTAGNCVATGEYGTNGTIVAAMVEEETNGSWLQATQVDLPNNVNPFQATGTAVSCADTVANCTMAGDYDDGSQDQAIADSETNGTWAQAVAITAPMHGERTNERHHVLLHCCRHQLRKRLAAF